MTHKEMFSDARWLMPAKDLDAALFRSVFEASAGEKAEITIYGLGYFILYINGKRGAGAFLQINMFWTSFPFFRFQYKK